jgi:hypothetical protein
MILIGLDVWADAPWPDSAQSMIRTTGTTFPKRPKQKSFSVLNKFIEPMRGIVIPLSTRGHDRVEASVPQNAARRYKL